MSEFIYSLKKEHEAIKEALEKIGSMDITSREAREQLVTIQELFITHLKKEDEEMYPRLRSAAASDEQLMSILNYMEDEIKLISRFVFIFFDKYAKKNTSAGFDREFSLISSTLIKRIEKEEEVFFHEFKKIAG